MFSIQLVMFSIVKNYFNCTIMLANPLRIISNVVTGDVVCVLWRFQINGILDVKLQTKWNYNNMCCPFLLHAHSVNRGHKKIQKYRFPFSVSYIHCPPTYCLIYFFKTSILLWMLYLSYCNSIASNTLC